MVKKAGSLFAEGDKVEARVGKEWIRGTIQGVKIQDKKRFYTILGKDGTMFDSKKVRADEPVDMDQPPADEAEEGEEGESGEATASMKFSYEFDNFMVTRLLDSRV